jgi:CubicO group peptidase (beta-lactamase class C family)
LPGNLVPRDSGNPYADYSAELMFEFLSKYQLTRDVGAQFEYSNLGVGLLGEALARRAGMSYEQLVTSRVLRPLGMSDTRITLTPYMSRRLAAGHDHHGHLTQNWDVRGIPAAGALRSSTNDMLKFATSALTNDGPLGPAFALAERPRRTLAASQRIGLNWLIAPCGPIEIVWHNGGTGGYRSYIGLDKRNQRAVVILTNSSNGADDIGQRILVDAASSSY